MKAASERAAGRHPCRIRPGGPGDVGFLWEMLYEAAFWRPDGPKSSREEAFAIPELVHYVDGWGRPGDAAVVALDPDDGAKVGAGWYRLMPPDDPGYGFVDAATPEISIAVVRERRGTGIGKALLQAMTGTARSDGFAALSLSVAQDNPAITLYERAGFGKLRLSEGSWTMRAELSESTDVAASKPALTMMVLEERLAVCRLDAGAEVRPWMTSAPFFSVTRSADELSVVCPERFVPDGVRREEGWRAFGLEGPFEFSVVGVLASVATPLAEACVGIFAVSTFDTDYVLVKEDQLEPAVVALRGRGHEVRDLPTKGGRG